MVDMLLTADEVAALLGVTSRTVNQWRNHGRIRAEKRIGNAYVYAAAEVARVMKEPRPRRGRPKVPPQGEQLPLRAVS